MSSSCGKRKTVSLPIACCSLLLFAQFAATAAASPVASGIFYEAFNRLQRIENNANIVFTDFIEKNMDCADVQQCTTDLTSLRLYLLPEAKTVNEMVLRRTWDKVLTRQLSGLRKFAKILRDVSDPSRALYESTHDDAAFTARTMQRLRTIGSYIDNLVTRVEQEVEREHCQPLDVESVSDEGYCEICHDPSLPSRQLEIIRNYTFLQQLRDYISHVRTTALSLLMVPPLNRCPSQP